MDGNGSYINIAEKGTWRVQMGKLSLIMASEGLRRRIVSFSALGSGPNL